MYLASIGPDDDGTSFRGVDEIRDGFKTFFGAYAKPRYSDIPLAVDGNRGFAERTCLGNRNPASGCPIGEWTSSSSSATGSAARTRFERSGPTRSGHN